MRSNVKISNIVVIRVKIMLLYPILTAR